MVPGRVLIDDVDAALVVTRDDVARPGRCPADGVAGRAADEHSMGGVAQVGDPVDVGADVVPLDRVPRGVNSVDLDAGGVGGDHVPLAGGGPTDDVVVGARLDPYTP